MKHLLLHSISDGPDPICLNARRFRFLCQRNSNCIFTFDDGYADVYDALRDAPPALLRRTIVFLVAGRIGLHNDWDSSGPLAGKPLLGWDQIVDLSRRGVCFGSHGLTHAELTSLDDAALEREVKGSKEAMQERLGDTVAGFSYPYGSSDARVRAAVARRYSWAMAARYGRDSNDRYAMPRVPFAGNNRGWLFRLKASCLWLYDLHSRLTPLTGRA
jgi:peptidoglycan/xylan/chitin deacetylase (PgdA/CDA1 family)